MDSGAARLLTRRSVGTCSVHQVAPRPQSRAPFRNRGASSRPFNSPSLSTPCSTSLAPSPSVGRSAIMRTAVAAAAGSAGSTSGSQDLLVVGPGVLGSHLGTLWQQRFPGASVLGLTNTNNSHARLSELGLQPNTKATMPARTFPYVAFCAPPSGSADYGAEVAAAVGRWDGTGAFVFTSSMSVCSVTDGATVKEDCPTVAQGAAPGTDKLLAAEAAARKGGGNVLRLVGLYHQQRGAHTYFLKVKDVPRPSDFIVNLIHYEDAARLAASVLAGDGAAGGAHRGQTFLGSDNHPVTFKKMMAACVSSGLWPGAEVTFTVPDGGPGSKSKVVDNSGTRASLGGWTPVHESFVEFMGAGGRDVYNP